PAYLHDALPISEALEGDQRAEEYKTCAEHPPVGRRVSEAKAQHGDLPPAPAGVGRDGHGVVTAAVVRVLPLLPGVRPGVVFGGPGSVLVCPGGVRVCPGAVVEGLVVVIDGAGAGDVGMKPVVVLGRTVDVGGVFRAGEGLLAR